MIFCLVAILEMNISESLVGEVEDSGLGSTLVESVVDDEEDERVAENDRKENDEGISTEPETLDPVAHTVSTSLSANCFFEEATPSERHQLEMTLDLPIEAERPKDDLPTTEQHLIYKPGFDPKILTLRTLHQKKTEDGNGVEWTGEFDGISNPPPIYDTRQQVKELKANISASPVTSLINPLHLDRMQHSLASSRGSRMCYGTAVAIFVGIVFILLIIIFVLESKVDFPMISHVRHLPAVKDFRVRYYVPLRDLAEEIIHGHFGI